MAEQPRCHPLEDSGEAAHTSISRTALAPARQNDATSAFSRSLSFSQGSSLRQQTATQSRIDDILKLGAQRQMGVSSSAASLQQRSDREAEGSRHRGTEDQDQSTSGAVRREDSGLLMRRDTRNYQSTQEHQAINVERHGSTARHESPVRPWWADYYTNVWSVELENKGSVARDHLALERTFLAWLRTSLAFASIGIAITQLFRLNISIEDDDKPTVQKLRHLGKPLGATFLGISILILILGYQRYAQSQSWVMQGKFPASRGTIAIVSLISFALMLVSLLVVVIAQPSEARDDL